MQGPEEGGGVQQQGPIGQDKVALPDVLQQLLGHARLANGTGREVQQLVAVVAEASEEFGHARLGPVTANQRQDLAHHIRPETTQSKVKGRPFCRPLYTQIQIRKRKKCGIFSILQPKNKHHFFLINTKRLEIF